MHLTLKKLLLKDENWYRYHQFYSEHGGIRESVEYSINKILSCRHYMRGHAHYHCSNPSCTHEKRVHFSCKDRGCSACGKIATDNWLQKNKELLPPCPWQHITFTMPKALSDLFLVNRHLLNQLPALAGKVLNKLAKAKGLKLGIFMALHTFGRTLNWHVHLHVSVTQGGLTNDLQWKSLFFKKNTLMTMWRYALITFLRIQYQQGTLTRAPEMGCQSMSSMLAQQYAKYWQVHCAKPHKNPKKDIEYLGRYIKRPAIANSRLVHYNGTSLLFKFLNHRTKQTQYTELHPFDFISRFIQHLPEKGFRLIRYFGFLANRLRAPLLPIVSSLFNHQPNPKQRSWALRVKHQSGSNPLHCILCKHNMRLSFLLFKLSSRQLMNYTSQIALQKPIRIN